MTSPSSGTSSRENSAYEEELHTDTGGLMVIVQYPGPTTGARPIYDDRFNLEQRKPIAEERTDR